MLTIIRIPMKTNILLSKLLLNLVVITIFLAGFNSAYAGTGEPLVKTLERKNGQLKVDSSVQVVDLVYESFKTQLQSPYYIQNKVAFSIDENSTSVIESNFTASVRIRITAEDIATSTTIITDTLLTIFYDSTGKYVFEHAFYFLGADTVEVKILEVNTNATWDVWNLLRVSNEMVSNPVFIFDCETDAIQEIQFENLPPDTEKDELYVNWEKVLSADEYDLEWTYIDSTAFASGRYGTSASPNKVLLFDQNSSRVSIKNIFYRIPLIYDNKGTLFFRVRPVQMKADGTRLPANWGSDDLALGRFEFNGHEENLNWQSTTTFAEDGKRKTVVQYFDGSLRSRQTVTKDNSTDTTIITETFYDYQGRPIIQVLPAPGLNNIIQYSQNFNRSGLNTPYDKDDFDLIDENSTYGSTVAGAMSTTGGASNYYSPQNPRAANGVHQFIPDAKSYPFTETEYTQDNTGRISRQSGVGEEHKLGSGHETVYYYGSVDQKEIDALFGTEAGHESHYFKTMVRDANGQLSVSYTDMHGRTVATALAGKPDAKLDLLPSYDTTTVTQKLSNPNSAIIRGLIMESKKSILVTREGAHIFNYTLNPDSLIVEGCDASQICFDCLYDLRITITDDRNNEKLGGKAFDTLISNFSLGSISYVPGNGVQGFNVSFSLDLEVGSYEVTKQLSVSQSALNYYRDSAYLNLIACKTMESFIEEQRAIIALQEDCKPSCDACLIEVGDYNAFRTSYLEGAGILELDAPLYENSILEAHKNAIETCNALCDNTNELQNIRRAMLEDMMPPSGQYANRDSITAYSVFYETDIITPKFRTVSHYKDENGDPALVYDEAAGKMIQPQFLTAAAFEAKFSPSWAEALLQFHPEYSKLQVYETSIIQNSLQWDIDFGKTETFQEALVKGYLNPTNNSSFPSKYTGWQGNHPNVDPLDSIPVLKAVLEAELLKPQNNDINTSGISIWALATVSIKCSGETGAGCYTQYTNENNAFDTTLMCQGDLDMAWRFFRQIYLNAKRNFTNAYISTQSSGPSVSQLVDAKHNIHFGTTAELFNKYNQGMPNVKITAETNAYTDANNAVADAFYQSNCESYATQWLNKFDGCGYTTAQRDTIIARMIQVCKEGSDVNHPYGSSSVRDSSNYEYSSFEDVIRSFNEDNNIENNESCNVYGIQFPKPYDRQGGLVERKLYSKPDSCECSVIGSYYEQYDQQQANYATFSDFMLQQYKTSVSNDDLYTLLQLCDYFGTSPESADCNYLVTPIVMPPVFNCDQGKICIDCDEFEALNQEFFQKYPGNIPSANPDPEDSVQLAKNELYGQFMNHKFGFNKTVQEYLAFSNSCEITVHGFSCDSLQSIVDSFNLDINPYRMRIAQQSNYLPPGQTYNVNLAAIIDSGSVRFPDSVRNVMNGRAWVYTQVVNPTASKLCFSQGASIEGRFKFLKDVLNPNDDFMYFQMPNGDFTLYKNTTGSTPGLYLKNIKGLSIIDGSKKNYFSGVELMDIDPNKINSQWNTFKFTITQDRIKFYFNGVLIKEIITEGAPLNNGQSFTNAFFSHHAAMDWIKIYNADDELQYFEDFNSTSTRATVNSSFICESTATPCDDAFVNYFNTKNSTSLNFEQIQTIYASCGKSLNVCDNNFNTLSDSLLQILNEAKCTYNSLSDSLVNTQACGSSLWMTQGYLPGNIYFRHNEVSHPNMIDSGTAKMPYADSTISYGSVNFTTQRNFCVENEYTIEARIRNPIPRNTNGILISNGDLSFSMDNTSQNTPGYIDEDFVVSFLQRQATGYYQVRGVRTYDSSLGSPQLDNWRTIKYAVKPESFRVYVDDTMIVDYTRDGHSSISVIGTARMVALWAKTFEVDWFKLYAENDSLIFHEDFSDVNNLAKPVPGHYCPRATCDVYFTNFLNTKLSTTYSFSQIDSLYDANEVKFDFCANPATLCGTTEPVFHAVDVNQIDNCSDSSFFIHSKATELYKIYRDSLANDFTTRYVDKCLEAYKYESFTVTREVSEFHYTLYYYDQAGNLVKTIPPAGAKPNRDSLWLDSVAVARASNQVKVPDHELPTNYRYNTLNQVVAQHSPDGGKSQFWYDRLGRLTLSQNASQHAVSATEENRLYSYTKYDQLGRITEVGQVRNAQSQVSINQTLTRNNVELQDWFTTLEDYRGQITNTVYDIPYETFVQQYEKQLIVQRNLRNRVSYVWYTDTASASYNTASFYSYDIHGNVDSLLQDYGQSIGAFANVMNLNANRFKKLSYNYDLISGKVNMVAYQRGWGDQFYHRYGYDAENRLILSESSTDSLRWEKDAQYNYYMHGPLARTTLGHQQVQGIDYAYTLQGWLKGVNSTGLNSVHDMGEDGLTGGWNQYVARDAYGYNLNYYTADYSNINENKNPFPAHSGIFEDPNEYRPLYNGNISSMAVNNRALDRESTAGGPLLLYNYTYDQLNRITAMDAYNGFNTESSQWTALNKLDIFKERVAYDGNGNILNYLRHGHRTPHQMDNLSYKYYSGTNRLSHVLDSVASGTYGAGQGDVADIDNQSPDNYHYDEIGNLVRDVAEGIDTIKWTVYGKIREIIKTPTSANTTYRILYSYDPQGNRISKLVERSTGDKKYTWYVRDAQGNVMATYTATGPTLDTTQLTLTERHIYGSSRLGIYSQTVDVDNNNEGPQDMTNLGAVTYHRGYRQYELSNHLGNVLATVSDKKTGVDSTTDAIIDYFEADIVTASDYYPFGMLMPGRNGSLIHGEWTEGGNVVLANLTVDDRSGNQPVEYVATESIEFLPGFESVDGDFFVAFIDPEATSGGGGEGSGLYRYGFNGKEMDNEVSGSGNQYDYGFRIYSSRLGRFLSVDPMYKSFPMLTPYQFASNNPLFYIDYDGLEGMNPMAMEAGLNYVETRMGMKAMKGDKKAQEAFSTMLSTKLKFGMLRFGIGSFGSAGAFGSSTFFTNLTARATTLYATNSVAAANIGAFTIELLNPDPNGTPGLELTQGDEVARGLKLLFKISVSPLVKPTEMFILNTSKLSYFFGKLEYQNLKGADLDAYAKNTGRTVENLINNQQRALSMSKDFEAWGIRDTQAGFEKLSELFSAGLDAKQFSTKVDEFGITIQRELPLMYSTGGKKGQSAGSIIISYFYRDGNMNSTPEISSVITKFNKK